MRGTGDELSVGERIAFFRRRRGLTQATLASLVGRSEEWVSSIERGRRQVRRLDVLTEVARALRVGLPDLLGQPVLMEDDEQNDDIPVVRDALMAPSRLSRLLYRDETASEPVDPERSRRYVEQIWFEFQAGRVGRVVAVLPDLISTAQRLENDRENDKGGWAVSARIHHLAATTLSKVGEADLSWIAAERATAAAEQSEDVLSIASAARAGVHAFLANGRYDDAMNLGLTAARWLEVRMRANDPVALSLAGMLHLRTAMAAARNQDRSTTTDLIRRATVAAEQVDDAANHWQTGFGPTNVEVHRLAAAIELGDIAHVAEHAPRVRIEHLPTERRASHLVDTGKAQCLLARDDEALASFLRAEQVAPQIVRHSAVVREAVKAMHRRAPVTSRGRSSRLVGLASRCRAIG
jgi:transcriptional regulator with XRE-family HTH domain